MPADIVLLMSNAVIKITADITVRTVRNFMPTAPGFRCNPNQAPLRQGLP